MKIQGLIPEHILKRIPADVRSKMGKAGRTIDECQQVAMARDEKHLQGQIEGLLRRSGVWFARQRMDRKSNLRIGVPDFLICLDGRFVAWEIKHDEGKTTPEQDQELAEERQKREVERHQIGLIPCLRGFA